MDRFFLSEIYDDRSFTGGVVNKHVEHYLLSFGYKPLHFISKKNNNYLIKIIRFLQVIYWSFKLPPNAIIFFHVPVIPRASLFFLKLLKKRKIFTIGLVHDIDGLRFGDAIYLKKEKKIIQNFKHIIVHNERMQAFVSAFYPVSQTSILYLFDYFCSTSDFLQRKFDKVIALAANLQKADYLNNECWLLLRKHELLILNIYGKEQVHKNLLSIPKNIKFYGAIHPDNLPMTIQGSFGIVWDGDTISTCKGTLGNYLYYNTPHKLCMYLSAGMPVIVWDESAMADWVLKKQVGFVAASWKDAIIMIESTSQHTYTIWHQNAIEIGKKLRKGFYLKTVLNEIENNRDNL